MTPVALAVLRCLTISVSVAALCNLTSAAGAAEPQPASEILAGYPCSSVDPELYTHQQWTTGARPYDIPFSVWDEAAIAALKARMAACITPANRQRTLMMLRYIDDPYGPHAQVRRLSATQLAAAAQQTAAAARIRDSLASVLDLRAGRERQAALDRTSLLINSSQLPPEQNQALLQALEQKRQEVSEDEAAQEASAEKVAREEDERKAAEQQARNLHDQQVAQRAAEAELQRKQLETQQRAAAEQAQAEAAATISRYYNEHSAKLTPELVDFLDRNPKLKAPDSRDSVMQSLAVIEAEILALETCRSHDESYPPEWAESQRRLGVLQQLLLSYHSMTLDELTKGALARRAEMASQLKQVLDASPVLRAQVCSTVLTESSQLADFTR